MASRLERLFERYRRRGDGKALAAVFDRTAPEVLRIAMHFAKSPADAEDLVQQTYLTAIERAASFDAERRLMPWLLGILRNHARVESRRKRPSAAGDSLPETTATAGTLPDLVEWTDSLAQAIEALSPRYRQVLVLRLRHGLEPAAIADVLGLGAATVRTQLHRGLAALRSSMARPPASISRAALPLGVGLAGIRERVLSQAATVQASTASAATITSAAVLGVAMTKTHVAAIAVLALCVGTAITAWSTGAYRTSLPDESSSGGSEPAASGGTPDPNRPALRAQAREPHEGRPRGHGERTPADEPAVPEIYGNRGSVSGVVRFEDGTPLQNELVKLRKSKLQAVSTDGEGRFRIDNDWVSERFLALERENVQVALSLVRMALGEVVEVEIVIERGIDLDLTVRDEEQGDPIAGVTGRLERAQRRQGYRVDFETAADGRVHIPYLPLARYRLILEHPQYEGVELEVDLGTQVPTTLTMARGRSTRVRLEGAPDAVDGSEISWVWIRKSDGANFGGQGCIADGGLELKLPPPGAYSLWIRETPESPRFDYDPVIVNESGVTKPLIARFPDVGTVEGTLHDARGLPLAKHTVRLGRNGDKEVRTDDRGRFRMSSVPAGAHDLFVVFKGGTVSLARVQVRAAEVLPVDLVAKGLTIHGRVLVGTTPLSPSYGGLSLSQVGTWRTIALGRTNGDGYFAIPYVPPGDYHLGAWTTRGTPISQKITVVGSLDVGVLKIQPFLRIPLEIDAGAATPPNRIEVRAWVETKRGWLRGQLVGSGLFFLSPRVTQDEDGNAWLHGVPKRALRLEFDAQGFETTKVEVSAPSEDRPIQVRMLSK